MNVENINKLIDHMESIPEVENINKLIDHLESIGDSEYDQRRHTFECGSPACIAGHAVYLAKGKVYDVEDCHISLIAGNWLGIHMVTKQKMFCANPMELNRYSKTDAPTTKDAVRMLKNFLETGKVVWRKENEC